MTNPIPVAVRGWLYVLGIIVGSFVAVVLPDLLIAVGADQAWTTVATRAAGALTLLLSTLGRANLGDPAPVAEIAAQPVEDGAGLVAEDAV